MTDEFIAYVAPWLTAAAIVGVVLALAWIAHYLAFVALGRVARRTPGIIDDALLRRARRPLLGILILFALTLVVPSLAIGPAATAAIMQILPLALTVAVGWLALNLTHTLQDVVAERYDMSVADNLRAREMYTRMRLIQRILAVLIVLVTASVVLMSIPSIRQIGVTLFASAGIAGIVAGFAARPVLSNLLAGIQIALTQPIRIDDVVIVEGEWGWIEEIRMTFVVVRIWDLRRMVVPLSWFIEKPFQNWTRTNADIIGSVFLYTDYAVPVGDVRRELQRILEGSRLWDGKVASLQVTNATDRSMELRALMSARSSPDAWDLRCDVREKLIDYIRREHPDALPRLRAELVSDAARTAARDG